MIRRRETDVGTKVGRAGGLPSVSGALLLAGLVWTPLALGQVAFDDDLETGNLSRWSIISPAQPGSSIAPAFDAGHRGSYGLRMLDGHSSAGNGGDACVRENITSSGSAVDVRLRFWFRVDPLNELGAPRIAAIQGNTSISTLVESYLYPTYVEFRAWDAGSVNMSANSAYAFDAGQWSLVEMETLGVGGADGGARLYLDGELVAAIDSIDWSGVSLTTFSVGECWGYRPWLGTLDFDDVRASNQFHASTLEVAAPDAGAVGECLPLDVTLKASAGVAAPAPYDLDVTVEIDGGIAELLATDCLTVLSTLHFDAGQVTASARARPITAGVLAFTPHHPDFLSGSTQALIAEDGGTASTNLQRYALACDCSAGVGGIGTGILAVLWLAALRGRRETTPRRSRFPELQ